MLTPVIMQIGSCLPDVWQGVEADVIGGKGNIAQYMGFLEKIR